MDTAEDSVQPEPVKVTADEVNKIMQAANISQPDADKLLAASRGEFVEGISDPNDPKWVKGIETCDSVNQNQSETEQNDQKAEQPKCVTRRARNETIRTSSATGRGKSLYRLRSEWWRQLP
ncbi:hypothetical protein BX27_25350 [Escherichia coli O121:H19 str. 2009C-4750]|nr:hypothetical protein BX27_25350 [Escherichia coli O121:H19 str. 2009C-4750]